MDDWIQVLLNIIVLYFQKTNMKLGKNYWKNEAAQYRDKCLYFAQYIGQYFGSTTNHRSHRRIMFVVGCAVYYGPGNGYWIHIGNAFLWLRMIGDLNFKELSALDKTIFPDRPRDSEFAMLARCGDVIYRTKDYHFMDDKLYTVEVHIKMISLRMATTWYDGGKTEEKISIEELVKRGWIAGPEQIKDYKAYYKEKI